MQNERLIAGYLEHAEAVAYDCDDPCHWAHQELHDLVRSDPESAWPAVVEVVARVTDNETLEYVSADILEDLVCADPRGLIDRIEVLATSDAHFRRALGAVWGWSRIPADVRARLDALTGEDRLGRSETAE
jgi:hypothetical protein